jgi:hypothetical protein
MNSIPIYLNPARESALEINSRAAETLRWLGFAAYRVSHPPYVFRHSFRQERGGRLIGAVKPPRQSEILADRLGRYRVMIIWQNIGFLKLSAADVWEQAKVGGCGLEIADLV